MFIDGGTTTILAAVFEGNFTTNTGSGAALSINSDANVTIDGTTFTQNSSTGSGGAVVVGVNSAFQITTMRSTLFDANASAGSGGAITASSSGTLALDNCEFLGNGANGNGGALSSSGTGTLTIRNGEFHGNTSGSNGGAIRAVADPQMLIASSSFSSNSAVGVGGGISFVVGPGGTSTVRNVALWGNGSDMDGENLATITYACSQEFLNIDPSNQLALTDPFVLGPNGELFLDQDSACVDNGDDVAATADYAAIGLDWQDLTTASDGTLDLTPVDIGVHYLP